MARRDERATPHRRLHDHHHTSERRHDAVAPREMVRERRGARGELAHHQAFLEDGLKQPMMGGRMHHVWPCSKDRDSATPSLQSTAVRLSIHAQRKTAHDDRPAPGECAGKPRRGATPVPGCPS